MTNRNWMRTAVFASLAGILTAGQAFAVPYASGVRNTAGTTYEFVLNEAADNVTIKRDGGSALSLGSLSAGRHAFDLAGFNAFDIEVSNTAAAGWATISDSANSFTHFGRPNGLAVNSDPSSAYFGTIYVAQGNTVDTVSGRTQADGIYAMTADQIGVDLSNFSAVADPNSTSAVGAPSGWTLTGSSNSPWKMGFDDASNLIVVDWSDANGGIKYASPDLQTGGLVLANEGGPGGGVVGGNHGSIVSQPYVTGSVGNNMTVWAMDEDMPSDSGGVGGAGSLTDGNSVWRWDVGNATDYNGAANLEINSTNIPLSTTFDKNFLNLSVGVLADSLYSPVHDKWYLSQRRSDGNQSGLVVITADGVDGNSPTLEFSTLDFSDANGLDGYPGEFDFVTSDILRHAGEVELSPDGSTLYVHRVAVSSNVDVGGFVQTNPHLGVDSNQPGAVLIIPLDENGIPIIELDENGTPGDPSDDLISNWDSVTIASNNSTHTKTGIEIDAAGNMYTTNNVSELVEVFSPGGATLATTSNNAALTAGAFDIGEPLPPPSGDYNGNGVVDAADYTMWRDTLAESVDPGTGADGNGNGVIDNGDYDVWRDNYGASAGLAAAASAAVPEPAAVGLLALAVMGFVRGPRRR